MCDFTQNHRPGEGAGYKPPMNPTVFNWLCINTAAIIIVASVLVYTLSHIG